MQLKNPGSPDVPTFIIGEEVFQRCGDKVNTPDAMASPLVTIENKEPLLHCIHFSGQPMLNQRTRSGYGCEIWAMLEDQTTFTYLSTEHQSPYVVNYSPSAIGKTVSYRLRWIDNLGNGGPWSEILNQTIV
jgi:hypothetical protein